MWKAFGGNIMDVGKRKFASVSHSATEKPLSVFVITDSTPSALFVKVIVPFILNPPKG